MKTAEAVGYVLDVTGLTKYRMAKELGLVSATSINQWLRGTKMSEAFVSKFEELYGVQVDDSVRPPDTTST
jgi:hypothetical protein